MVGERSSAAFDGRISFYDIYVFDSVVPYDVKGVGVTKAVDVSNLVFPDMLVLKTTFIVRQIRFVFTAMSTRCCRERESLEES